MKIEEVDYKKLPGCASEMREIGVGLNKEMTNAYQKIGNMSSNWYGVRYDKLIDECNRIVPEINDMLTLVIDTIPFTLQQVASNYAKVDGGTTEAPMKQKPQIINNISKSGKTTMRFIESDVTSARTEIFNCFSNASNKMDQIESIFNSKVKLAWKSDASAVYSKKFVTLKKSVSESIANVKKAFNQLMQETLEDMKRAETSNTVL